MSPFELSHDIERARAQLASALTSTIALLALAPAALGLGVAGLASLELAGVVAALALLGAIGAGATAVVLRWRRDDLRDDVLLAGYRHVDAAGVSDRACELLDARRRVQLAETLERFLEAATEHLPTAVPLDRRSLRQLAPQVRAVSRVLRAVDVRVDPAAVVLVRRLVTDGARSPLFRSSQGPRELERALERIRAAFGPSALGLRAPERPI